MNADHQKKQRLLKYALLTIVGAVFLIFSAITVMDYYSKTAEKRKSVAIQPQLPLDGVDPKEIWVDQMRSENEIVQGKVDFIQDMIVTRTQEEGDRNEATQNELTLLRNQMESLRNELRNSQTNGSISGEKLREEVKNVSTQNQQMSWNPFSQALPEMPQEEVFTPITFVACPEPTNLHHVNRTIPAGTTVKAILLSSVDMPCGVKGSTDPLPVKLRIIADGRLPHEVRARLRSGIITACVYGDLSSERVYFRLEKLTQVRPDGHYIETQVAGYVSGEDGKYGLRGIVVDKSAQLIENAMISGFLSGVSNFFEATAMARLYPCTQLNGGTSTEGCPINWKQSAGQLAIAGGSEGVTNAMDALTDYFIKRAEQLRPVIQITPGRIVDITFSDCADLGDLYTHERVRNSGKVS